jgi:hypothetical protein
VNLNEQLPAASAEIQHLNRSRCIPAKWRELCVAPKKKKLSLTFFNDFPSLAANDLTDERFYN